MYLSWKCSWIFVNYDEVESRLSQGGSVQEFRLDKNKAKVLVGDDAEMSLKEFFSGCDDAVHVIFDPQCEPDGWYPQKEASSKKNITLKVCQPQSGTRKLIY